MITYLGLAKSIDLDGSGWVDGWDDRRFQWPHLWWLGGRWVDCCLWAVGSWLHVVAVVAVAAAAAFGGASGNGVSASSASAAAFGGASGRAAGNGVSASGA